MSALVFIDGNPLRAAELKLLFGDAVAFTVEPLQAGFATSANDPAQRARDKVAAHPVTVAAFAEAVDLTTPDGKSLRLELDSENENRFCKWWRERPAIMQLAVAIRRGPAQEIEVFTARCEGRIADKPAGAHILGWDRLFVPADGDATLAQLCEAKELVAFRRDVYGQVAARLGAP